MKLVSLVAAAGAVALFAVCAGCGEKSGTQLKEDIEAGRFNQEESLKAIESSLRYTRQVAAEFLAKYGDAKVVKPLVKHMHSDSELIVRRICLMGLLERGLERKDDSVVPEFVKVLKVEDSDLRQKAVYALGELRTEEGYKALMEMLKDKTGEIRAEAVSAIAKFGKKEALKELAKLYGDEDAKVRRTAVEKIAEVGGRDPAAIDLLIPALDSADFVVKRTAVERLGEAKAKKAAEKIIPLLHADNYSLRVSAAKALGQMRVTVAAKPLAEAAKNDRNLDVRRAATEALSYIGGPEQEDVMIAFLDDSDSEVRKFALKTLERLKVQSEALKAKLRYLAQHEPHTDLREYAKRVLDGMK